MSSKRHLDFLWLAGLTFGLAGCASVPQQHLVSKANMQFSEHRVFSDPSRTVSQLEPGRVATGGAQASVCASCR